MPSTTRGADRAPAGGQAERVPRHRGSAGGIRYTTVAPEQVIELLLTAAALEKLGARGISADEVGSSYGTRHVVVRNPRAGPGKLRAVIGRTEWSSPSDARDRETIEPLAARDHRIGIHRPRA